MEHLLCHAAELGEDCTRALDIPKLVVANISNRRLHNCTCRRLIHFFCVYLYVQENKSNIAFVKGPILDWLPWPAGAMLLGICAGFGSQLRAAYWKRNYDPFSDDPPIGTKVSIPNKDAFGNEIDTSLDSLLIFAGACTKCSLKSVRPQDLEASPQEQVLIVYLSGPEQVRKELTLDRSPRVRVIADAAGKIRGQLQANQAPRYYLIRQSAIAEIWKDTEHAPVKWVGMAAK